jgi:hypothetical protein
MRLPILYGLLIACSAMAAPPKAQAPAPAPAASGPAPAPATRNAAALIAEANALYDALEYDKVAPLAALALAVSMARPTVNIVPAAKVYLDGDLVGTTPLVLPKNPAGRHSLTLERTDGPMKKTVAVTLKDGEDKKLPFTGN